MAILLPVSIGSAAPDQAPIKGLNQTAPDRPCIILLHGLGRTYRSLRTMAAALEKAGFKTFNIDYPSRKKTIQELAMQVIPEALEQCRTAQCDTIHFVTHSMGGILVRYYLSRQPVDHLGRVVMLGPPNQGSEAADAFMKTRYFRWYNGPAGLQLGTDPEGITAHLGPVTYPVGVITGNQPTFFDAHFSIKIPGENDGKVSVERAKVQGMTDFLVLPYSHTFIMEEGETIAQTIQFLRQGKFKRP